MTRRGNRLADAIVSHETQVDSATNNRHQRLMESPDFLQRYGLYSQPVDEAEVNRAVTRLLCAVGENPSREGLLETPKRVAKAYRELVAGYTTDPVKLVNNAIFHVDYDDMIVVYDIEYYSLCEHHLLPFVGRAHVAYIPDGKIVGLSKIPRIVDMFARRLQVQERLTRQVADFLCEVLEPRGVAVVMTAKHMCSMMRGVKKHHSNLATRAMLGEFKCDRQLRDEFVSQIPRQPLL